MPIQSATSLSSPQNAALPQVVLIATGGTIAGKAAQPGQTQDYTAGALSADSLLEALPGLADRLRVSVQGLFALDSKDMTLWHMVQLRAAVVAALQQDEVAGVVITHGTDTLEETAFFLELTLPKVLRGKGNVVCKPVVLTAAMRPATALSADGPLNLWQALQLAAGSRWTAAHGQVAVVVNDQVFAGHDIAKQHTHHTGALAAVRGGALGSALDAAPLTIQPLGLPVWVPAAPQAPWLELPDLCAEDSKIGLESLLNKDSLKKNIEILFGCAGASSRALQSCYDGFRHQPRLVDGVVLALAGCGSVPESWLPILQQAREAGMPVVRASRIAQGGVTERGLDVALGTLPAGVLTAPQARIALWLSLLQPGWKATPAD